MNESSIAQVWAELPTATQAWLIQHNGEHLPADVVERLFAAAGGRPVVQWWAGGDDVNETQLTDAAVDWIEEQANGEH